MEQKKSGIFIPLWLLLIMAAILIFAGYKYIKTQRDLKPALEQQESIKTKIKQTESEMDSSLDTLRQKSESTSELSTNIKTKTKNEKSEINTVRDTSYDAMCKFITEFKPDAD